MSSLKPFISPIIDDIIHAVMTNWTQREVARAPEPPIVPVIDQFLYGVLKISRSILREGSPLGTFGRGRGREAELPQDLGPSAEKMPLPNRARDLHNSIHMVHRGKKANKKQMAVLFPRISGVTLLLPL